MSRIVRIHEYGDASVLRIEDVAVPAPAADEVQIAVKAVTSGLVAKLKKLGLKVEDSDKGLRVIFGSVDAKALIELAQVEEVRRIDPL